MIAAVLLAVALAAPHPHSTAQHSSKDDDMSDFDIDLPDIDIDLPDIDIPDIQIPEIKIPKIHIPKIHIPRIDIPDVSFLIAHASKNHQQDDDADDEDCDEDCGPDMPVPAVPPVPPNAPGQQFEREDRNGMHVYRMQTTHPGNSTRIHIGRHDDDSESDESGSTARAQGKGSATLAVKGPVTFRFSARGGNIEVTSTDKPQVTIRVEGQEGADVALYSFGDRVEPRFRNRHSLRGGKLHVELPKGSRLEVESMSGDVTAQHLGEAKIRTLSGDIHLTQVGKLDVQSISGDVQVEDAAGPVRLHTVSGKATLAMRTQSPQVEFQSASGSLDFKGACGKDCHMSAATVSGDLHLALGSQSSFELSYSSHSGELRDGLDLSVKKGRQGRHGGSRGALEGTYGKGEGVIEADAFSGNLTLSKQ
jgi:Putative adhesin